MYREGLLVVQLSLLSGRALVVKARGVLGSTPSNCSPFFTFLHFRLIASYYLSLFHLHCHPSQPPRLPPPPTKSEIKAKEKAQKKKKPAAPKPPPPEASPAIIQPDVDPPPAYSPGVRQVSKWAGPNTSNGQLYSWSQILAGQLPIEVSYISLTTKL